MSRGLHILYGTILAFTEKSYDTDNEINKDFFFFSHFTQNEGMGNN